MPAKIKVALLDFDGTLVTQDILDVLCRFAGKEAESKAINEAFHKGELPGLSALVSRINFLKGMSLNEIKNILKQESYLRLGTEELFAFFHQHNIITILASGNILPVLEYYQQLLGITHVVGSQPTVTNNHLIGIDQTSFSSLSFKVDGIKKILKHYEVTQDEVVALGDSPSDIEMFKMSGFSLAVNPKGNIAEFADTVVKDDLKQAVKNLEAYQLKTD